MIMNTEFIEKIIFENEKNTPFRNIRVFYAILHNKYKLKGYHTDLYRKIINYQVDKYGHSLNDIHDYYKDNIEINILRRRARSRENYRRNKN